MSGKQRIDGNQKSDDRCSGWGSQWYYSPFKAKVVFSEGSEEEEVEFLTAEHWMMVQKALLFKDEGIARSILNITEINSGSMAQVKSLGRRVANFEEDKWASAREKIVLEGTLHKFEQNSELKTKLLETGDRIIVEASPLDRIWGVGFGERNALKEKTRWGQNLLGVALMETRGRLLAWEK